MKLFGVGIDPILTFFAMMFLAATVIFTATMREAWKRYENERKQEAERNHQKSAKSGISAEGVSERRSAQSEPAEIFVGEKQG